MDNPAFEGEKSSQKGNNFYFMFPHFFVKFSGFTECNSSHANKRDQGLEIKRKVGLWSGVAFIISRVIGKQLEQIKLFINGIMLFIFI